MTDSLKETDLYQPVRSFLEQQGYLVRSEVKHCDIAAMKGDDLIIVELKTSPNMRLLVQATDRFKLSDAVYVAIPEPKRRDRYWRGIKRVLSSLELGLLTVHFSPLGTRVQVEFDPLPYQRRKQRRQRRAVIEEIAERSGEYNVAGSVGTKLITAYRENAILVAVALAQHGPMAPRQLRALGTGSRTLSILSNNYYNWFQRVARGVYQLTDQGAADLEGHPDLVKRARERLMEAGQQ